MGKKDCRRSLVDSIQKDLIGPREGPKEEFDQLPTERYLVGVLYPKGTKTSDQEETISLDGDSDSEANGPTARVQANAPQRPSSMGLSFIVSKQTMELDVNINWATYSQKEKGTKFKRIERVWNKKVTLADDEKDVMDTVTTNPAWVGRLRLRCIVHEDDAGRHVHIFLLNKPPIPEGQTEEAHLDKNLTAKLCAFGPCIQISGDGKIILARERYTDKNLCTDLRSMEFLYRDRHEFSVGHGCSTCWKDEDGERCGKIMTTFLPEFSQPAVCLKPKEALDRHLNLTMAQLGDVARFKETIDQLNILIKLYEKWIFTQFDAGFKTSLSKEYQEIFDEHQSRCVESVKRMREGLRLIRDEPDVKDCFIFMNNAMFYQRAYYSQASNLRKEGKSFSHPDLSDSAVINSHVWYPFQIAFILQSIPGIFYNLSEDRKLVDLLWIPTGGGKTEAYLGLAVMAMTLRRLRNGSLDIWKCGGVSVVLRYTLRLLTIQQFQRAATLMCACEVLRNQGISKSKWGEEPFRIGLFVGEDTTPNRHGDPGDYKEITSPDDAISSTWYAKEHWEDIGKVPDKANPFQILFCPWCGTKMDPDCYTLKELIPPKSTKQDDYRLVAHCSFDNCNFHKSKLEIPILTVDEDIYSLLPSMLIGTVDKFAMLPLNDKVASLFGHVDKYCRLHGFSVCGEHASNSHKKEKIEVETINTPPSPDLIIQDELHLINGPLGSLVGLYETTIERLCQRIVEGKAVHPKIIASTATITRASEQVWNLFRKDMRRFPSSGTIFNDSFFVRDSGKDEDARLYIGLFPSGTALRSIFIRVLRTLLIKGKDLSIVNPPKDWDEYWTIVSYFNSLRDLGGGRYTIEDDVQESDVLIKRGELIVEEMTSRRTSRELPLLLDALNVLGSSTRDKAIDILSCSNMFSVGVDVQRLGLMVMNNQPKSTAEYIQSTGRVGRRGLGLVVNLFNWGRPRDQSHFEHFYDYHNRIQAYVEASTITPYSEGARDRALHAQYTAMVRILGCRDGLSINKGAEKHNSMWVSGAKSLSSECVNLLKEVAEKVEEDPDEVERELKIFIDEWIHSTGLHTPLTYRRTYNPYKPGLSCNYLLHIINDVLEKFDDGPRKLTPTSMRNVEHEIAVHRIEL